MLPKVLPTRTTGRVIAGAAALAAVAAAGTATATAAPHATPEPLAPACHGHALAITTGDGSAGAGHAGFVVRFKNVSSGTCSLTGYPGVDALGRHGQVLRHAKRVKAGYLGGASSIEPVNVRPGHYASAVLEWVAMNHNAMECHTSATIAITAANTRRTVHRHDHVAVCQLEIHPTVSGRHGTGDLQ